MDETNKAIVDLVKVLQASEYNFSPEMYKSLSLILLELLLRLMNGMDHIDDTIYYPVERDLIIKLLVIVHTDQEDSFFDHVQYEIEHLCEFYEELKGK
jgi:hypothetical protein